MNLSGRPRVAPGVLGESSTYFHEGNPPPASSRTPCRLNRCSSEAVERWISDAYKFPPYQYERQHLMTHQQHDLRSVNSDEREIVLGFGRNHTMFTMPAGLAKENPEAREDKWLSLNGDSFSMLSFGWLISQMCKAWVTPLTPTQIIRRFGQPRKQASLLNEAPLDQHLHYGNV